MAGCPGLLVSIQGVSCCGLPGRKWHQRDAQACLSSSPAQHKELRRWVSCLKLFHRWVRIGTYARRASKGGTYCSVCIWLAFGMWIPRMLWLGKVGLKVGLKWPSSATGPSPLGSMGPSIVQVKTQTIS